MTEFGYEDYLAALEGAGPKLRELILERAANDTESISFQEFVRLCKIAYPDAP